VEFIFIWGFFALLTAVVAGSKNRTALGWFLLGAVFGIFAFIMVLILPSIKERDPYAPSPDTHVKCPDCRELVFKDARICKHCGIALVPQ
jgi:Na+/melibiose symporter-like transporter